ncbi:MAG: response regulator [Chitinophagaceae bacterium]|nr:response regulator [Chitinophagaceae bacterium]
MDSKLFKNYGDEKLVLLIDDDPDELELYNYAISSLPFSGSCIPAHNKNMAFQQLDHLTPDLIIIDYTLPGKNGLDILGDIRKLPGLNNIPIVFCSTVMNDQLRSRALEAGATYCIKKLNELRDISNLLNSILVNEK